MSNMIAVLAFMLYVLSFLNLEIELVFMKLQKEYHYGERL